MDAATPGAASVVAPSEVGAFPEATAGSAPETPAPSAVPAGNGRRGSVDPVDPEGPPFTPTIRSVLGVLVVLAALTGLVLRFWTRSDLWLDEALTVNIARQPLHTLPSFLKRDGAPPLFYALLHFWMKLFGTSDLAVRSLPGVIGVVTLPFAWLAGKRVGGAKAGWAVLLLVTTSPFAVRFDTETRMYSLVVLLTVVGFLALDTAVRHQGRGSLVGVAAVTGLLLYTHYWSIYLIGTVIVWLAWQAWRGRPEWRSGARASLVAVAIGCLTFLPWVPTFLFQSAHTGTPWATPANFAAMVDAIASFAGGSTNQGRALALIFFALAGVGLFGTAVDRHHIDLDIRTRPLGRPAAFTVAGTLAAAVIGGFVTNSAFDARYASVVFIPLILLVAIGLTTFRDRRVRSAILTVAVIAGLASSIPNIRTNRTQAGQVAAAIDARAHAGDVVAYCPDQLGPAAYRLLPKGRYRQTTFPRGTGPEFVDWVDYAHASRAASPLAFAQDLEAEAAKTGGQIFVVWAPGYQTFGTKCEGIVQTLQADPAYRATALVTGAPIQFYQPMWLVQLTPTKS